MTWLSLEKMYWIIIGCFCKNDVISDFSCRLVIENENRVIFLLFKAAQRCMMMYLHYFAIFNVAHPAM